MIALLILTVALILIALKLVFLNREEAVINVDELKILSELQIENSKMISELTKKNILLEANLETVTKEKVEAIEAYLEAFSEASVMDTNNISKAEIDKTLSFKEDLASMLMQEEV